MTSQAKTAVGGKRWNRSKTPRKPDLKASADKVAAAGRTGADGVKDSEIIHVNKRELPVVDRALKRFGGSGKRNPRTGAKEYAAGPGGSIGGSAAAGRDNGMRDSAGADRGQPGTSSGGKSSGSSGNASAGSGGSQNQTIPATQASPTGKKESLGAPAGPGGSLAAASANEALGEQGDAQAAASMGARPMKDYRPGDVPAVKGADAIGIGGSLLGGATLGALRALSTAAGEGDPLAEHMGKQVGWSGTGDESASNPGRAGKDSSPAKLSPSLTAAATGSNSASTSASTSGASLGSDGNTITVNPDGTVRTQDTSVAGLRAKRRYGAKTTGVLA